RIYDSAVNALAMATAYTLTSHYTETIGMVFASMSVIAICECVLYVIEVNIVRKDVGLSDIVEVCRLQQKLLRQLSTKKPVEPNSGLLTNNQNNMLLSSHDGRKHDDLTFPFFVLLQEVLKI